MLNKLEAYALQNRVEPGDALVAILNARSSIEAVAVEFGVTTQTIRNWQNRYNIQQSKRYYVAESDEVAND